jgi:putative ABC transport system permease protein
VFLAWKEIKYAKLRFGLIIGIIFLVGYVVFMLSGLANGLADGNKAAIEDWQASTIVLSADSNSVASASQLTQADLARVKGKQTAAVGVYSAAVKKVQHTKKENISIFGAKSTSFVVPKIIKGRLYHAKNEVIIAQNLANEGYQLHDQIKIGSSKATYTIVGITKATTYSIAPVAYLSLADFTQLKYGAQPFQSDEKEPINMVVVKGTRPSEVSISTTTSQTKLKKLSTATFISKLPGYTAEKLTLDTMIYFLFVVVAAIIGIFIYVMTLQKISMFGVLKAQGIPTRFLLKAIIAQAAIVSVIGILIAFVLALLTSLILPSAMPFALNLSQWVLYGIILILVSMLGGLFSIRTVSKLDPITAIGGE